MLEVFDEIPFHNPKGGVWKQGYDITYSMEDFQTEPLTVFVVPHSHNDPGKIAVPGHVVPAMSCPYSGQDGSRHLMSTSSGRPS